MVLNMLEVRNVDKYFDDFQVLDNITFDMPSGVAAVLIGRNGAGKSTLIRCVAGLLRYEGSIKVDGYEVYEHPTKVKRLIGYLPQTPPVRGDLTGYQIFNLYLDLYDIDLDIEEWFERFELADAIDVPIDEYSGGMRQRLFLAMAIAHDPKLILMDEPMNNLDSVGKSLLVDIIHEYKERGKSFLISGHRLSDFITYADEIILIDEGELLYKGSIEELFKILGIAKIYIYSPDRRIIGKIDSLDIKVIDGNRAVVESDNVYDAIKKLVDNGVTNFFIEEPSIDTIIERLGRNE